MQTLDVSKSGRFRSVFRFPARPTVLAVCLLATFMTGCQEESQITTRTVPKPPKDRMLAAIVPVGRTGWFFKLSGSSEAVAAQESNFRKLLKSLEIDQGEPTWEAPDGWTEEPGEGMRKATFKVKGDGPTLECTVIGLPSREDSPASIDYALANINRWRGQLGMESLSKADLEMELKDDDEIHSLSVAENLIKVTWVNFEGRKGSGQRPPMGEAPFAGGAPHAGAQPGAGPRPGSDGMGSRGKGRMLAAIVPVGKAGWFFKIQGDDKLVAAEEENFVALISSLQIKAGKVAWQTPKEWHELAGSGMREATFLIGEDDSQLECSVIDLPSDDPAANEYLLSNINRWRGQVGLGSITEDELISDLRTPDTGEIRVLKIDGGVSVPWVNISSSSAAASSVRQPGPEAAPGPAGPPAAARPAPRNPGLGLTYKVPSGWEPAEARTMVLVGWDVKRRGKELQIYISKLTAGGSDLVANVNRWRGQAGLKELSGADVQNTVDSITVGGSKGHSIEIRGAKKSVIGAIIIRGGDGWFFKLQGDPGLAAEEKDNFEAWLKSIQFE